MYVSAVTDVQRDKMLNGLLIFQTVTHILCISLYPRTKRVRVNTWEIILNQNLQKCMCKMFSDKQMASVHEKLY